LDQEKSGNPGVDSIYELNLAGDTLGAFTFLNIIFNSSKKHLKRTRFRVQTFSANKV
jgi:hypothetical protein